MAPKMILLFNFILKNINNMVVAVRITAKTGPLVFVFMMENAMIATTGSERISFLFLLNPETKFGFTNLMINMIKATQSNKQKGIG
jgi:hypothetical protein